MNKPSLDELLSMVDSKYSLVVAAAKRARNITEENGFVDHKDGRKSVSMALKEIADGELTYTRTKEGIK